MRSLRRTVRGAFMCPTAAALSSPPEHPPRRSLVTAGQRGQSPARDAGPDLEPKAAVLLCRVEPEAARASSGQFVAAPGRPTGKRFEGWTWRLLGHESGRAGMLAGRHESGDRQAPLRPHRPPQRHTEFIPKRNSERSGGRGLRTDDAVRPEIGENQGSFGRRRRRRLPSYERGAGQTGDLCHLLRCGRGSRASSTRRRGWTDGYSPKRGCTSTQSPRGHVFTPTPSSLGSLRARGEHANGSPQTSKTSPARAVAASCLFFAS